MRTLPVCTSTRELLDYFKKPSDNLTLPVDTAPVRGEKMESGQTTDEPVRVPQFTREFWTAGQRKASSIHEISYRACFKPHLPRFFIDRLTERGDTVYDPFSGRGTTVIEAGLLGRRCVANDANPLSTILTSPRFFPPHPPDVKDRLDSIPDDPGLKGELDLSMFYHPDTETEILSLKNYLIQRREQGSYDHLDAWIQMVATNRLTGHSRGFFSVYTLPPNQAVSGESQKKINERRHQSPEYRDTRAIILKKTMSLVRTLSPADRDHLSAAGKAALFLCRDARETPVIPDTSVQLTVTSPPFLDVVQYPKDNWLRCWFNDINEIEVGRSITMTRSLHEWSGIMRSVFNELYRVTAPGGFVAFEVGEVRKGSIKLEDAVLPIGAGSGFLPVCVLINRQQFTKTAHIWGIGNNTGGTNSNRIVLFRKKE